VLTVPKETATSDAVENSPMGPGPNKFSSAARIVTAGAKEQTFLRILLLCYGRAWTVRDSLAVRITVLLERATQPSVCSVTS